MKTKLNSKHAEKCIALTLKMSIMLRYFLLPLIVIIQHLTAVKTN